MSTSRECEVVITRSGAHAMLDHASGEVMHPVVGPLVEAEQLYLQPSRLRERLSTSSSDPLVLFDVGLGAGSNAALAFRTSEALRGLRRPLTIVSFETSLAAFALAATSEHRAAFGLDDDVLPAARALLERGEHRTPHTHWRLVRGDVLETIRAEPAQAADVVFWDPFSPRANPALWTAAAFEALHRACRPGVSVHTYSTATAVRSALLLAGFAVGQGPSTGEKAQTTLAALDARDLAQPLDLRWLTRLTRSSAPFPSDAPPDAMQRVHALAQFSPADARTSP
ncbi:MAG: MnmC family methyltransferase [Myxococcales bacterium]